MVTSPSSLPVTADDLSTHLRIDLGCSVESDDVLEACIQSAVSELEYPNGWLGRSIVPQTLRLTYDDTPPSVIQLPGAPVTAIVSVNYLDIEGDAQTVSTYYTDLSAEPAIIWTREGWPAMYPDLRRFWIDYTAGYATVPDILKQWVLIRAADLYRDREGMVTGQYTTVEHITRMLDGWRVRCTA